MSISISCRELGLDCIFMYEGDSEESVIESLIRHVQMEHDEEWFGTEEIYQSALAVVRTKAA